MWTAKLADLRVTAKCSESETLCGYLRWGLSSLQCRYCHLPAFILVESHYDAFISTTVTLQNSVVVEYIFQNVFSLSPMHYILWRVHISLKWRVSEFQNCDGLNDGVEKRIFLDVA